MTTQAVLLLAGLFLAHFLGDFTPLATPRMLAAKANAQPIWLIAAHAGVHTALVTLVILLVVLPAGSTVLLAAAIQFATHFLLDAGRAKLGQIDPILNDPGRNRFWHLLGLDQLAHAFVLVGIAALVL